MLSIMVALLLVKLNSLDLSVVINLAGLMLIHSKFLTVVTFKY